MNTVLSTNSATLARVVSMPEWRATVSSSPMARKARPSRERPIQKPMANTRTASARSCQ